MKIAFFDAKPYDRDVFDALNREYGYTIKYFETKFTPSHQGFFTREALGSIAQTTLNNIRELSEGKSLSHQVTCTL
jgi:hypothetical protein